MHSSKLGMWKGTICHERSTQRVPFLSKMVYKRERKGVGPWGGTGGGGQVLGVIFRGYVSLASQSPYPIIVDSYYRPHLSHLGKYVIFAIPT